VIVVLTFFQYYSRFQIILNTGAIQFTGYKEAGRWIKTETAQDSIVLAGSPRALRYYSGINFTNFGGRLGGLPKNQKSFEKIIQNTNSPVILEIDYWERIQPKWVFPITKEKLMYLESMGFRLIKTVKRPIILRDGTQKNAIVIWIFIKEGLYSTA